MLTQVLFRKRIIYSTVGCLVAETTRKSNDEKKSRDDKAPVTHEVLCLSEKLCLAVFYC